MRLPGMAPFAWSKQLDKADVAELLGETLSEEKAADQKLTSIAEGTVNLRAAM